jgi:hypothetical protein
MKQKIAFILLMLAPSFCMAQQSDVQRTFVLDAVAPTVPALAHQLMIDPIDRQSGDAVPFYRQAIAALPADTGAIVDAADDAHDAGKSLANDPKLSDLLARCQPVFDLLNTFARQDRCEWIAPGQAINFKTQLWHLNTARSVANLLKVRCYQQIDAGKTDDAIATIQIEYALARDVYQKMPVVGGLVAVGIANIGHELVACLINTADSPNLYWPLVNLPQPLISLRESMGNERQCMIAQLPILAKARRGKIETGDWNELLKEMQAFNPDAPAPDPKEPTIDPDMLKSASQYYADTRHIALDEASKVDPNIVMASFYLEQFQTVSDEQAKLYGLPLPEMLIRSEKLTQRLDDLKIDKRNIAVMNIASLARIPLVYARLDRKLSALIAVEAIRAYAAEHSGKLPAKLEDVTETPVRANPMTGTNFSYHVDGTTATLSDETSPGSTGTKGRPLIYTLRVESHGGL